MFHRQGRKREQPERRKEHEDYDHPHGSKIPTAPSPEKETTSKTVKEKQ